MIGAFIPTRYHPPTLEPLIAQLEADGVYTIVFESEDWGHQLYRMWNEGVRRLKEAGCTDIAILNDDIVIAPGTLAVMAQALRMADDIALVGPEHNDRHLPAIPSRVRPRAEGHNFGYAFMFKGELPLPEFDETFHVYASDIIFERAIREMGYRTCRVEGLFIRHLRSFSVKRWKAEDPIAEAEDKRKLPAAIPPPPAPPPGGRYSWEQARRLRKAAR